MNSFKDQSIYGIIYYRWRIQQPWIDLDKISKKKIVLEKSQRYRYSEFTKNAHESALEWSKFSPEMFDFIPKGNIWAMPSWKALYVHIVFAAVVGATIIDLFSSGESFPEDTCKQWQAQLLLMLNEIS